MTLTFFFPYLKITTIMGKEVKETRVGTLVSLLLTNFTQTHLQGNEYYTAASL